jgi:hypothetical protein
MISTLGGIVEGENESDVDGSIERLNDPAGTFYRYTLAASLLGSRKEV